MAGLTVKLSPAGLPGSDAGDFAPRRRTEAGALVSLPRGRLSRCDPCGCVVCLRQYLWHRIGSLGNRKYGVIYIYMG